MQYYVARCQMPSLLPPGSFQPDDGRTVSACPTVNGTVCRSRCVLPPGKKSTEDDTRSGWKKACNTGNVPTTVFVYSTKEDAEAYAFC